MRRALFSNSTAVPKAHTRTQSNSSIVSQCSQSECIILVSNSSIVPPSLALPFASVRFRSLATLTVFHAADRTAAATIRGSCRRPLNAWRSVANAVRLQALSQQRRIKEGTVLEGCSIWATGGLSDRGV